MLDGVGRGAVEEGWSRRVGTEAKLHHLGRQRLRGGGVAWVHGKHEAPRLHKDRPQVKHLYCSLIGSQTKRIILNDLIQCAKKVK